MERELANAELEKGELVSAHGVLVKMRGMPVRTHARTHAVSLPPLLCLCARFIARAPCFPL